MSGHAIEARIYAEDPERGFLPAAGRIGHLRQPDASEHVRVDGGVRQGDEVGVNYDPMIAKLIAWDSDRAGALRRLRSALGEFEISGLATNIPFLLRLTAHRAFATADRDPALLDTGLIERYRSELFPEPVPAPDEALALAALSDLLHIDARAREAAALSRDPFSPWQRTDGWRLNEDNHHRLAYLDNGNRIEIVAHYRSGGYLLELPGEAVFAQGRIELAERIAATLNGRQVQASVVNEGEEAVVVFLGAERYRLEREKSARIEEEDPSGRLVSPLPGNVVQVMVAEGAEVQKGQPLMIIEAMKMEHVIVAPHAGRVSQLYFSAGERVAEGAQLLALENP